jgi:hypothetical protein
VNHEVAAQLRAAGWWPGRKVEATLQVLSLEQAGFEILPELLEFLAEYTPLEIRSESGDRLLWIDAARAVTETDPDWASAYSNAIGTALAPIGGYSHMTIYLARDGRFYGGFDSEYGCIAPSVEELVDSVLNLHPPVRLAREL